MSKTMTPSEIAYWLDIEGQRQNVEQLVQAAATIRELELQRDNFATLYAAAAKGHGTASAKLKIATEALESVGERLQMNGEVNLCATCEIQAGIIAQALARIKEV